MVEPLNHTVSVRKDMDEHEGLSNFILRHKLKYKGTVTVFNNENKMSVKQTLVCS